MSGSAWDSVERDRANVWRRYIRARRRERRVPGLAIYCPLTDDDMEGLLDRLELVESTLRAIAQDKTLTRARCQLLAKRALGWRWRKRNRLATELQPDTEPAPEGAINPVESHV